MIFFCPPFPQHSKSRRSRPAFTLLEFLIAMTILAIVFGIGITGYSRARQQAELELAHDRVVTSLRIAQEQVRQGYLGNMQCRGLSFSVGHAPRLLSTPFTGRDCSPTVATEVVLPFAAKLGVTSLQSEIGVSFDTLSVFSMPPQGNLTLDQPFDAVLVTIGVLGNAAPSLHKTIRIHPATSSIHSL